MYPRKNTKKRKIEKNKKQKHFPVPPVIESASVPLGDDIFIGRQELSAQLAKQFRTKSISEDKESVFPTVVLCTGLAGIGKTALVLHYANTTTKAYRYKLWFRAPNPKILADCYRSFAKEQLLINVDKCAIDETIKEVQKWFARQSDWLIIYDNVESFDDIDFYLPKKGRGDILITSRLIPYKLPKSVIAVHVNRFFPAEADQLIGALIDSSDDLMIPQLAEVLDYLPLALTHACAYIRQNSIDVTEYLDYLKTNPQYILSQTDMPPGFASCEPLINLWDKEFETLSIQKKAQDEKTSAQSLLILCAYLRPHKIPYFLLQTWYQYRHPSIKNVEESLQRLLQHLFSYSFIQLDAQDGLIQAHSLLQLVIRCKLSDDEIQQVLKQGIDIFLYGYAVKRLLQFQKDVLCLPAELVKIIIEYDSEISLSLWSAHAIIEAWETMSRSLIPHLESIIIHCNQYKIPVDRVEKLTVEFNSLTLPLSFFSLPKAQPISRISSNSMVLQHNDSGSVLTSRGSSSVFAPRKQENSQALDINRSKFLTF
jgi:hypothetical protein